MAELRHRESGRSYFLSGADMDKALASGEYEFADSSEKIAVASATGDTYAQSAADYVSGGIDSPETAESRIARAKAADLEREHGGALDTAITAVEGGVSGLTLGGSDALARAIGAEEYLEGRRARKEANPYANLAGEIAGTVAPSLLTGGAGALGRAARMAPSALAERGAARIGAKAGGGLGGTALRFGTEGAMFGAGEGVREVALSEDPVTFEGAVGTISSSALLGGGLGVGAGVAGKLVEKGIQGGRRVVQRSIKQRASAPMQVVDDIRAAHDATGPAFLLAKGDKKAPLAKSASWIRGKLDAPESLAKSPRRVDEALEKQAKVLRELQEEGAENTLARLGVNDAKVADELEALIASKSSRAKKVKLPKKLAAEYRDVTGIAGKGSLSIKIEDATDIVRRVRSGELHAARVEAIEQLPDILAANQRARDAIEVASAKGGGGLIGEASGAGKAYAAGALLGLAPGGPLGALAGFMAPKAVDKLADIVTGRMAKAGSDAAEKISRATDALFDAAESGAKKATPALTKTLATVRLGDLGDKSKADPKNLPDAYKARSMELMAQVQRAPGGEIKMTREARAKVAERLAGVAAIDPVLADKIETHAARRVEYLAQKLPKRPDVAGPMWRPPEAEMASFARTVAAVEDPVGALERIAAGSLAVEDIDVLRDVYPGIYEHTRNEVLSRLTEYQETMPYAKRVALSHFLDIPVEPAMEPGIFLELQSVYQSEEGTDGGTHGPTPKPQFGSISKPEGTPAQERGA